MRRMHLLVEGERLFRRPLVVDGHVQRQHVASVHAGLRSLQRKQRRDQRAGARQQHERRGDLRDGEQAQTTVRAGRDPDAAVRQAEAVRRLGGGQPRNKRQEDRGHQRQADANPQQAGIDREIQRPDREARRITSQDRDHRPGDDHAERPRRRRTAAGFRPAASGAARPSSRRAPRESPARLRAEPIAPGSGWRRSSRR